MFSEYFAPLLALAIMLSALLIVLLALFMMAPQHKLSWLWRTACLVAALPPFLSIVGLLLMISGLSSLKSFEDLMLVPLIFSTFLSAPFAAAFSLAVAVRLRRAA
ncbi:MAG: hypothetical protein IOC92_11490 [Rhodobacter sp.]|nr:hypothetical protein [Rhodobacter sp.]MCA3456508.1 hypothetical protein [Rhodobacter sp.]MCA3460345.1 hypothetical protein [Rhodobacter sp.]MCA3462875.1 hypothetical protein [Rhodobacter sp.]MCA3465955.1 hypothetical protein [Rhodobacter sp.]